VCESGGFSVVQASKVTTFRLLENTYMKYTYSIHLCAIRALFVKTTTTYGFEIALPIAVQQMKE